MLPIVCQYWAQCLMINRKLVNMVEKEHPGSMSYIQECKRDCNCYRRSTAREFKALWTAAVGHNVHFKIGVKMADFEKNS